MAWAQEGVCEDWQKEPGVDQRARTPKLDRHYTELVGSRND